MKVGDLVRIADHITLNVPDMQIRRTKVGIVTALHMSGWAGVVQVTWSDGKIEGWDSGSLEVLSLASERQE